MTVTEHTVTPAAVSLDEIHRLSADEFDHMVAVDAFDGMRVELIDGYILNLHAKGEPHEAAIQWLMEWLYDRVDRGSYQIRVGSSLRVWPSQPEPDLMLVERTKPKGEHPTRSPLVIEVAWSSHKRDLKVKPMLYSAVVTDYWVVDLDARVVITHRDPEPGRYRTITRHGVEDAVAPLVLPDQPMSFGDLFAAI